LSSDSDHQQTTNRITRSKRKSDTKLEQEHNEEINTRPVKKKNFTKEIINYKPIISSNLDEETEYFDDNSKSIQPFQKPLSIAQIPSPSSQVPTSSIMQSPTAITQISPVTQSTTAIQSIEHQPTILPTLYSPMNTRSDELIIELMKQQRQSQEIQKLMLQQMQDRQQSNSPPQLPSFPPLSPSPCPYQHVHSPQCGFMNQYQWPPSFM